MKSIRFDGDTWTVMDCDRVMNFSNGCHALAVFDSLISQRVYPCLFSEDTDNMTVDTDTTVSNHHD